MRNAHPQWPRYQFRRSLADRPPSPSRRRSWRADRDQHAAPNEAKRLRRSRRARHRPRQTGWLGEALPQGCELRGAVERTPATIGTSGRTRSGKAAPPIAPQLMTRRMERVSSEDRRRSARPRVSAKTDPPIAPMRLQFRNAYTTTVSRLNGSPSSRCISSQPIQASPGTDHAAPQRAAVLRSARARRLIFMMPLGTVWHLRPTSTEGIESM